MGSPGSLGACIVNIDHWAIIIFWKKGACIVNIDPVAIINLRKMGACIVNIDPCSLAHALAIAFAGLVIPAILPEVTGLGHCSNDWAGANVKTTLKIACQNFVVRGGQKVEFLTCFC